MSPLAVGVRLVEQAYRIIEVDFDFGNKVQDLKCSISDQISLAKDDIELIYCGNVLEDEKTLAISGVKPGSTVHAVKKLLKETPVPTQTMSEQDIKALVIAFRTLALNPTHRNSLQKLSRPDILENIIQITPGLVNDPVAVALIQDPDLMVRLANFDTVRRIVEQHPALAEAANHIAATVHEEALQNRNSNPSTSAGFSLFDMLNDDDDDDMESSQSSDSLQAGVSRQPSFSITAAQLAAALASAREARRGDSGGSSSTGEGSSGITPEMVSQAMQQALAASASQSTPRQEQDEDPSSNLQEQMRQMREMGLLDDALNLQALQVAAGDVQAAVELVFSGAVGPDPPTS